MIKMSYFLWAEVVDTAVYILNRSPTKAIGNLTPIEAYSGKKPGIGHLKVFGSLCYVPLPNEVRQKLDAKSVKSVFVGYATCEKGYMIFDPCTKKLMLSRDVVFDETMSWNWKESSKNSATMTYIQNQSENVLGENAHGLSEIEESPSHLCTHSHDAKQERSIHESAKLS